MDHPSGLGLGLGLREMTGWSYWSTNGQWIPHHLNNDRGQCRSKRWSWVEPMTFILFVSLYNINTLWKSEQKRLQLDSPLTNIFSGEITRFPGLPYPPSYAKCDFREAQLTQRQPWGKKHVQEDPEQEEGGDGLELWLGGWDNSSCWQKREEELGCQPQR